MTRVLAIADDLTGALEVGAQFAGAGLASVVTSRVQREFTEPVLVLDTETRHMSAADAETAIEACAGGWPGLVYKKTDSTLRGNIGAELRALERLYVGPIAYVPAYPDLGRTVVDGVVHVDGIPLHETNFARDALNPVSNGRVRSLLDPESRCVVFDGRESSDVREAARTILSSPQYRVVAGPAAIAGALAEELGNPMPEAWPKIPRCLVVNGSRNEVSKCQIQRALTCGIVSRTADAAWRVFEWAIPAGADPLEVAAGTGRRVHRLLDENEFNAVLVF
ncbi:MAG TPA: four-carbon acid sugar kinase family protein, partial [Candidatus Solibacter sp.]|nr:four-carbon acid sugar kinase family protein [Candidatus Solibacter sp.]